MLVLALFIVAVGFVFAEVFLPSGGVLGFLGVGAFVASLVVAYTQYPSYFVVIAIAETAAFAALIVPAVMLAIRRFSLQSSQRVDQGYTSAVQGLDKYIGHEAVAVTPLRPSGTVKVGDKRLDAMTRGTFCPAGTNVTILGVESNSVVVDVLCDKAEA
jgi:membrane-bound serine protease (ClpP class)